MSQSTIQSLFAVLATGLLHSVWLFALLTGIGHVIAGHLKEASHRYLAYLLALLSLPLAFGTVIILTWRTTASAALQSSVGTGTYDAVQTQLLPEGLTQLSLPLSPAWTELVAIAYLVGLTVFLSVRIYQYIITLRLRSGGHAPDREWIRVFHELRQKVVPNQQVRWKITDRVRQVLVVGVFRPVILFPVGLLLTLTPAEVEAILLHELYHVRRYDALWNTVQLLTVSLFFYHPAVYWLSRRIDREREYVCDDAASAATEPVTYAGALVRLAKFSLHPKIAYSMSAVDNQTFTRRVKRLFGESDQIGKSRSTLLVPLALLPLCLLLAFVPATAGVELVSPETAMASQAAPVTGTVTDAETGEPIFGTAIVIQGTSLGTVSDQDGNFSVDMSPGSYNLVFSYTGYQTSVQSTKLNQSAGQPLDVQLLKNEVNEAEAFAPQDGTQNDILKGLPGNVLLILDGERVTSPLVSKLDPSTIDKVDVIKDKTKLAELGYGSDFDGAILITTKQ